MTVSGKRLVVMDKSIGTTGKHFKAMTLRLASCHG